MLNDWLLLIVYGLACTRLAILISEDKILEPLRDQLYWLSPPADNAAKGWFYQEYERKEKGSPYPAAPRGFGYLYKYKAGRNRKAGLLGSLISCASCTGVWVAVGLYAAHYYWPVESDTAAIVLALAMFPHYATKKGLV